MWFFLAGFLVCFFTGVNSFDFESLDGDTLNENFEIYTPDMGEARFLTNVSGIFNNSLLGIVAIFIGGIILFELALYALDVYYTQTYSGGGGGGYGSGYAYNKIDKDDNYNYANGVPLMYQDFPKYYDPFADTYRSLKSGSSLGIDKILEYIHLAYETYETGTAVLFDIDCQRRAVCEIYRYQQQLGELSKRARHSLDYIGTVPYLSLPDEINQVADELVEAKEMGETNQDCADMYHMCEKSLLDMKKTYDSL